MTSLLISSLSGHLMFDGSLAECVQAFGQLNVGAQGSVRNAIEVLIASTVLYGMSNFTPCASSFLQNASRPSTSKPIVIHGAALGASRLVVGWRNRDANAREPSFFEASAFAGGASEFLDLPLFHCVDFGRVEVNMVVSHGSRDGGVFAELHLDVAGEAQERLDGARAAFVDFESESFPVLNPRLQVLNEKAEMVYGGAFRASG